MRWAKILGIAGVVAVLGAAGTVAYQRSQRRAWVELPPDELRSRLHARLATSGTTDERARVARSGIPSEIVMERQQHTGVERKS